MDDDELLTAPIYEPSEAARLAQLSTGRVRRFLLGYKYRLGTNQRERRQRPVLQRKRVDRYASFLDLIELRFARAFLAEGFSPQRVRAAFSEAARVTSLDHPFARRRFFTSGSKIYLDVKRRRDDAPHLLELFTGGQWAIEPIVREYEKQIDFDPHTEAALRWYPLGPETPIVVDPRFSFGEPTLRGSGIRTANLQMLYLGEGRSVEAVAQWMEVSVAEVESALEFERKWSRRLAA